MTNPLAIQIGISIIGVLAGAFLILFGWPKKHDNLNWLLIGLGVAIILITISAVLIFPVNVLSGFMLGFAMLIAGSFNLYRVVRHPENSFMWPRMPLTWKAYKPVSERLLGTEGRKIVTRSGETIGAVLIVAIGLAIVIGVISNWLSSR